MDQNGKWLLCRLGNVWYGLDLSLVQEIVYNPALTSLPALGRSVAGIMDWMGRQITVVDIAVAGREGRPAPDIAQGQMPVVVLKAGLAPADLSAPVHINGAGSATAKAGGDALIGLLVDEVGEIISRQAGDKIEIDAVLAVTLKSVNQAFEYNDEIIFTLNCQELYRAIA
ncbi:MAG: chemotaxis protein CheW [Candidatus Edwardsbacteria bacterium]|nr:chemotaxis protein CheW [Candidatus Edwardsbacteria bacterium]MBU1576697.1 chemotaxis protein CheW [Candidatus Edwardsbacteria bacterium]MBU2463461.1 chemotaxis protein CheW [Candidatus Edwardsbacteria bacterium]MBU2594011.1 chemotaxis protein CheW [Candidatus Edwardsbacteria bacterium]